MIHLVPGLGPLAIADVTAPRIRRRRKNHFHDLRHTGNTLAGEAGASLRELMDRMGHSSTRAALIYQHRTSLRDKMIADEISRRAEARNVGWTDSGGGSAGSI